MRQAVMTEPGKIEFGEVQEPKAGAGEILLRIKRIGVCGSDIHVYHGKHPFTPYPVVQGHEYCGIVEAVGEGIKDIKPGILATARPQLICGKCGPCRRGDYHVCEELRVQGFQAPGCAQDLFVVPKERFIPLPESLTAEQGALVEPASVGAHSTARASDLAGKNAVVLGAGTIGNMVAQFVQCRGAKSILITDISDYRLEIAQKCGIKNTSNAGKESLADAVKRVFGGDGFQVAFEAAGVEATLSAAIANIEKGGEIVVLGVFGEKPRIDMAVVGEHELSLIGTLMYKHEDYVEAAQMIAEGKIVTEPLVTKHFAFEQYPEAYKYIEAQGDKTMKVMIDL
ncbi:MAG: zinc-dependent alcohol dehydrogenase [Planctomycetota bacterium]|jgi:L-iditol 2-dehydrogenase/threonine 3-dehydrogenase